MKEIYSIHKICCICTFLVFCAIFKHLFVKKGRSPPNKKEEQINSLGILSITGCCKKEREHIKLQKMCGFGQKT